MRLPTISIVFRSFTLAALLHLALDASALPEVPQGGIEETFRHPPHAARPSTWWHWMNGNVTAQGVANDLAAMKEVGLGGVFLFNANPWFLEGPVRLLSDSWLERIDQTLAECDRLGLEFGVHNCDGWSESGGPWITPERSMKVFTSSTVDIDGGRAIAETLPVPAHVLGFYRDVAVIAYPVPPGGRFNGPGSDTALSGDRPAGELARLIDGDPATACEVGTVEFAFPGEETLRSVVFRGEFTGRGRETPVTIEARDAGGAFRKIGGGVLSWFGPTVTLATEETRARVFRVVTPARIGEIELSDAPRVQFTEGKAARSHRAGHGEELRLYRTYPGPDTRHALPAIPQSGMIAPESVVNLTARLASDGTLRWDAPEGRWRILRFGYTSSGAKTLPATPEGEGLECDKLDPAAVRFHLDSYVGRLLERAGDRAGRVFKVMSTDSWECGAQNWTARLEERFARAHNYDLLAWLPALAEGRIVADADRTERFLWDWRRFLSDQIAENYFRVAHAWAREHGLVYVSEPTGRQQFLHDVANHRYADRTMGEIWSADGNGGVRVDNGAAASFAHVTGRTIVSAESFTGLVDLSLHPAQLKRRADEGLCAGVNHFTLHTFPHQAYETFGPGLTFGQWGLHSTRTNTWWKTGRAWIDYLARCCALLQQGRNAADVLYFVGEDVPNLIGRRADLRPALPEGYSFDGADVTAIMEARVEDGRIVLPSGQDYRVLLLPAQPCMRPDVLRKIVQLARDGAVIVGNRPSRSPSLRDFGEGDREISRLATGLWGNAPRDGKIDHEFGRGRVFDGLGFEDIFRRLDVPPDFEYSEAAPADARLLYVHRRLPGADIYFVSNQGTDPAAVTARFRAGARQPELWYPDDGRMVRPAIASSDGARVELPLRLGGAGSVFVVFREPLPPNTIVRLEGAAEPPSNDLPALEIVRDPAGEVVARMTRPGSCRATLADGRVLAAASSEVPEALVLEGPWTVSFAPVPESPGRQAFDRLVSWHEHGDERVRHFSGTAVYETRFTVPPDLLGEGRESYLDLGDVRVHAEVELNGRPVAVLWKSPYRVRIDPLVVAGDNTIRIAVTNLWINRQIGDARHPDDVARNAGGFLQAWPAWLLEGKPRPGPRVSFAFQERHTAKDALLPSGLLGPVRLQTVVLEKLR